MADERRYLDADKVDTYLSGVVSRYRRRVDQGLTPRDAEYFLRWANDLEAIRNYVSGMTPDQKRCPMCSGPLNERGACAATD